MVFAVHFTRPRAVCIQHQGEFGLTPLKIKIKKINCVYTAVACTNDIAKEQ